jgi:hypothetical protein
VKCNILYEGDNLRLAICLCFGGCHLISALIYSYNLINIQDWKGIWDEAVEVITNDKDFLLNSN